MDLSVRIILSLLIVLVALALGFFIRSALIKRFRLAWATSWHGRQA